MDLREPLMGYWYKALHAEFGVEVACSDTEHVRQKLYALRREAKDTEITSISLCISPFDPTRLWLVKRRKQPEPEGEKT